MMVALLLYGCSCGVYASRRIVWGCEVRVDLMAVTAMQRPNFRTIVTFRRQYLGSLRGLFMQVLKLCRETGLVKLVALDASQVKANASRLLSGCDGPMPVGHWRSRRLT